MITISPYLYFEGNCEEAFNFYKSVFGGEFSTFQRFNEMPPDPNMPIPDYMMDKVMHVSLPISKETVLMGSDSSDAFGKINVEGNNFGISIYTDSEAEVERIFNTLAEGGNITMPLDKTFWGAYFGMLIDKFNITWMVNCNVDKD